MIITVFNNDGSQPEKYSFTEHLVHLGRNPSAESSVTINSTTISRNHLKARIKQDTIQIMDLNSSNGTFLQHQKLQPNTWKTVSSKDKITIAQFQGYVIFQIREATIDRPIAAANTIKNKQQCSDSQDSQRSRSREKVEIKKVLPFKISQSTLKMLKDMTINRKTKQQRIKFLKLMGIGKAEQYWDEIEQVLKKKKGVKDSKKTSDELQKQFSLARSGIQKRGLGR